MVISWRVVGEAVGLTAVYAAVILILVRLLRWAKISSRWATLLSFLLYGLAAGLLAARLWPYDSTVYPNLWATLLGDGLTSLSGPEGPWLLRLPQVYLVASLLLCGPLGMFVQAFWNRTRQRREDGGKKAKAATKGLA